MNEWEALIRRRKMLCDGISDIEYEIERINLRLRIIERRALSIQLDPNRMQEQFMLKSPRNVVFLTSSHEKSSQRRHSSMNPDLNPLANELIMNE